MSGELDRVGPLTGSRRSVMASGSSPPYRGGTPLTTHSNLPVASGATAGTWAGKAVTTEICACIHAGKVRCHRENIGKTTVTSR